jgi:hypothetical protein
VHVFSPWAGERTGVRARPLWPTLRTAPQTPPEIKRIKEYNGPAHHQVVKSEYPHRIAARGQWQSIPFLDRS